MRNRFEQPSKPSWQSWKSSRQIYPLPYNMRQISPWSCHPDRCLCMEDKESFLISNVTDDLPKVHEHMKSGSFPTKVVHKTQMKFKGQSCRLNFPSLLCLFLSKFRGWSFCRIAWVDRLNREVLTLVRENSQRLAMSTRWGTTRKYSFPNHAYRQWRDENHRWHQLHNVRYLFNKTTSSENLTKSTVRVWNV